jgi:hypothetical protein
MYLRKLCLVALGIFACAFSFGSDNSHVCVSSDGSYILFQPSPIDDPVRMYASERCIYGDVTDRYVQLYVELKNPTADGLLFKGNIYFSYYPGLQTESWARIKKRADEIMSNGIWMETSGNYAKYKIDINNPYKFAYISANSAGVSLFKCSLNSCEFDSKVDGNAMFFTSFGLYARGFDPTVSEAVIREFMAQLFKM